MIYDNRNIKIYDRLGFVGGLFVCKVYMGLNWNWMKKSVDV